MKFDENLSSEKRKSKLVLPTPIIFQKISSFLKIMVYYLPLSPNIMSLTLES